MDEQVKFLKSLLDSCFLPELRKDMDSTPIQSEHFKEYHGMLENQLPLLYDFLQKHNNLSFITDDSCKQELQACLVLLLCEITANDSFHLLHNRSIIENARKLLETHLQLNINILEEIFIHYQNKLHKDRWKRQLGTIYGFLNFIESFYNRKTHNKMNSKWLTFSLSVALTVRELVDPIYKAFGIKIFQTMLNASNSDDIQTLNVHSVIYNDAFKDVYFMQTVSATRDVWNCLLKCLDYMQNIDSLNWSQVDDLMEVLIRNITLATDNYISICLFSYVRKLCAYFCIHKWDIESKCNSNLYDDANLKICHKVCESNNSYTSHRWGTEILKLFLSESYKLFPNSEICRLLLGEIHKCYMVCILPLPVQIMEPHLFPFLEKFIATLMKVINTHKDKMQDLQVIKCILTTFSHHIPHTSVQIENIKYSSFHIAFEKLLEEVYVFL